VLPGDVRISKLAWYTVHRRYDIEEQHHVLHVYPQRDLPAGDDSVVERRAFAELRRLGLARADVVAPELLRAMRLLTAAPIELHGWIAKQGRPTMGIVVASDGRQAVRARLGPHDIRLESIGPDRLAQSMIERLSPMRPGRGDVLNLPFDVYRDVIERGGGLPNDEAGRPGQRPSSSSRSTRTQSDADAASALLRQRRQGGGRVYAAACSPLGGRRKTQYPLTYLDTVSGRWLLRHKPNSAGAPWMVISPADFGRLVTEAKALLASMHH
jgi:hypothetical protein